MTTTIDQAAADHRPELDAEEDPGVLGRGSDAGAKVPPHPVNERPTPTMHARWRSDLCI